MKTFLLIISLTLITVLLSAQEFWITTNSCPTNMQDDEGNTYNTVLIGTQCWMAENLKATTYSNGTAIPNVTDNTAWENLTTGAYAWYNNDIDWKDSYGALYNWFATVDANGLCPSGWHVPTHDEWTTLTTYLGGLSVAGGEMKSAIDLWNSPNEGATNSSGFSGFPGGFRNAIGDFLLIGDAGHWWSSTEFSSYIARFRGLNYYNGYVVDNGGYNVNGFSVRCLRD